jgi:hypothetical protein
MRLKKLNAQALKKFFCLSRKPPLVYFASSYGELKTFSLGNQFLANFSSPVPSPRGSLDFFYYFSLSRKKSKYELWEQDSIYCNNAKCKIFKHCNKFL